MAIPERTYTTSYDRYISEEYLHNDSGFFVRELQSRAYNLIALPYYIASLSFVTIAATIAGLAAIAIALQNRNLTHYASINIQYSNRVLNVPFAHLLKIINPYANMGTPEKGTFSTCFLSPLILRTSDYATTQRHSPYFFNRNVLTRLPYLLVAVVSIICRIADGILGCLGTVVSLLTVGHYDSLNNFAYRNLTAPGLLSDLFHSIILFLNPGIETNINREVWRTYPANNL